MEGTMLDATRHRFGQNVQTQNVDAAPPLNIEHHAPAPHSILDEQSQKPLTPRKNLNPADHPADPYGLIQNYMRNPSNYHMQSCDYNPARNHAKTMHKKQ
jgi:hypothetical protein